MAKRTKKSPPAGPEKLNPNVMIAGAGEVMEQPITETLKINYMPYAMSVIVSRAIPEIDGFKPSHRKLLYTMYKMGLQTGGRIKSANIVGRTMQLNPHGDAAIYDTMVRLSRGYEALLHPYVDSKGNFGKAYSRDMAWAAARYTEAKLEGISAELFRDIEKETVDFVDNYDSTMKEPSLLPVTFPTILVNANTGIAVGMASSICPFNLTEVCEAAIDYLSGRDVDLLERMKGPDFPGGGRLLYDEDVLRQIYETGRGTLRVRSVYQYDKENNCIDVTEIPPTTTVEAIIEKITLLVKTGKLREISDVRDEIGLHGLRITIDLKRGTDPDKLMRKLFKSTPLEDTFSCNFNVLIAGVPRVMGVWELLQEWAAFRIECVRRRVYFDLNKKKSKLHLLKGLERILLDIDKAVKIVRETDEEAEVVPNLMIGFGIDQIQAEYVAEIKLRHLNREYILNRTKEIEDLERDVAEMEEILKSGARIKKIIVEELRDVEKKYGRPRRTQLYYKGEEEEDSTEEELPDYPVHVFLSKDGYFKKITPQSLRMSGEQKLKEGDAVTQALETTNNKELLFFTNRQQVYKAKLSAFEETKASVMGVYIPQRLEMEEGESVVYMAVTDTYCGYMLFFFADGKLAKVDMASYQTKTNRRRLVSAYCAKQPLVAAFYTEEDGEYLLHSSSGRKLLVHTGAVASKASKDTQGVSVMTQRKGRMLIKAEPYKEGSLLKPHRYRAKNLPAAGALPTAEEQGEQLTL